MSSVLSAKRFPNEVAAYQFLRRLFGVILILGAVLTTQTKAATYNFVLENTFIGGNPAYAITGSMTFDDDLNLPGNPFTNVAVQVVSPDGTFQMNNVWTTNVGPTTGIGLSSAFNPALDDFAIFLAFAYDLREAALNATVDPFIALVCPTPATSQNNCTGSRYGVLLQVINGFPETAVAGITGALAPAPVPLPAALPLLALSISVLGFFGWKRKRAN